MHTIASKIGSTMSQFCANRCRPVSVCARTCTPCLTQTSAGFSLIWIFEKQSDVRTEITVDQLGEILYIYIYIYTPTSVHHHRRRRTDGRTDGREGRTGRRTTDGRTDGLMGRTTDGRDERDDGRRTDEQTGRTTDRRMGRTKDGRTGRRDGRRTGRTTDGRTDGLGANQTRVKILKRCMQRNRG
jgi:hypothetical protein